MKPSTDSLTGPRAPAPVILFAAVALVGVALAAIRLLAPPDLMRFDQERQAANVLDVVRNGHWICQQEWTGEIASKPPLYNWLAAVATLPVGRINRFTVCLPAVLATVVVALLVVATGRTRFGWQAGLLGAMAYLLSPSAVKQVALVRTDGLFALTVTLGALAAYRAWRLGRGWVWFWLAVAASTLTKGPLGFALAAIGLLAVFWEWRTGHRAPIKGSQVAGVIWFVVLVVGWFGLAYAGMGQALINKLFVQELAGNAIHAHDMTVFPGRWFYKPPLYFLIRFAPWSLAACIGFWRVCFRPAVDDEERRFERFLFCWFFGGLVFFCLGASQRGDHLMPLLPATAWLAGRELARLFRGRRFAVVWPALLPVVLIALGVVGYDQFTKPGKNVDVQRTVGMQELAAEIRARGGDDVPLVYMDAPFALQFYRNTMQPAISAERAAARLRGDAPIYVAVRDFAALQQQLGGTPVYEILRWPEKGEPFVRIVGNRPQFLPASPRAAGS